MLVGKFHTFPPSRLAKVEQISSGPDPLGQRPLTTGSGTAPLRRPEAEPSAFGATVSAFFVPGHLTNAHRPAEAADVPSNRTIHLQHRRPASLFVISERCFPPVKTKARELRGTCIFNVTFSSNSPQPAEQNANEAPRCLQLPPDDGNNTNANREGQTSVPHDKDGSVYRSVSLRVGRQHRRGRSVVPSPGVSRPT